MKTEVETSLGDVLPSHFRFLYDDADQGWLEVPYSAIVVLNLKKQISTHSHQSGTLAYLEEGLDAPMFIRAYLKQIGKPGDHDYFSKLCSNVYDGPVSKIRNMSQYDNRTRKTQLET